MATEDFTKDAILRIIQDIQSSSVENKEEHFSNKYSTFKNQYPHLFKYVCENSNIQVNILELMLDQLDKIKRNESTKEKSSENVGQVLFNEYVQPKVEKMEKKQD